MRTETCLQIEFNVVNFRARAPKQFYPSYSREEEADAAAGQTFRHSKTLLDKITVQAGIKGAVTMTGYV
jgi:hypothetical protein